MKSVKTSFAVNAANYCYLMYTCDQLEEAKEIYTDIIITIEDEVATGPSLNPTASRYTQNETR